MVSRKTNNMNFQKLILLLWTVVGAVSCLTYPNETEKSRPVAASALYKRQKSGYRLDGMVVTRHVDVSLVECAALNLNENTMGSYVTLNYNKDAKICEGLRDNRTSAPLVATPSYDYYEISKIYLDVCNSNPCLYTGTCETVESKMGIVDFRCNCPYPMGGKICADLICESCYRNNDLVIFLNNTMPSTFWIQSYNWCKAKGMELFLDKDQVKHKFVVSILTKLHPSLSEQVCYWIGLNRTSTGTAWKYTDGTLKDKSYGPWATGRPGTSLCVEIANGQEFLWNWDDEDCNAGGSWKYYPLCEKYYPFLLQ